MTWRGRKELGMRTKQEKMVLCWPGWGGGTKQRDGGRGGASSTRLAVWPRRGTETPHIQCYELVMTVSPRLTFTDGARYLDKY